MVARPWRRSRRVLVHERASRRRSRPAPAPGEAARVRRSACGRGGARRRAPPAPSPARVAPGRARAAHRPPRDARSRPRARASRARGASGPPCPPEPHSRAIADLLGRERDGLVLPAQTVECLRLERAPGDVARVALPVRALREGGDLLECLLCATLGQEHGRLRAVEQDRLIRIRAPGTPRWSSRRPRLRDRTAVDEQLGEERGRPLRLARDAPDGQRLERGSQQRLGLVSSPRRCCV